LPTVKKDRKNRTTKPLSTKSVPCTKIQQGQGSPASRYRRLVAYIHHGHKELRTCVLHDIV